MKALEGKPGTWSYCGSSRPHPAHAYNVVMNEGRYPTVCLGATGKELNDYKKGNGESHE